MSETILEMKNVNKQFGGVKAIDNFSVRLEKGKIHGLIGPNGAGKTTIFNNITGIYAPTSGTIHFDGNDITGQKPFMIARLGIARTFQNIRLFSQVSVLENILIASHMDAKYNFFTAVTHIGNYKKNEINLRERAINLLKILELDHKLNDLAGSLPYGDQRKVEIARALALNPKLLLLDEPAAGMNHEESKELVNFIKELKEKFNLTILMIEHHMDVVSGLCENVTVLNFGKTIACGNTDEIKNNKVVIEAYLGEEEICDVKGR
ncbi:ABC transporter ATP-binding protein [Clostridium peptidivorans]|uniref:ABC transporter ATP-binding protein n=1 Tax=Clostridium peptidivorans TaxID=100174 RepID=UPI000BE46F3E|nr:ABC transporter ATP-binding protein [Clostridium peptidivorans]